MNRKSASQITTLKARAYIRVSHVGTRKDTLISDSMQLDEARRYAVFADLDLDEQASKLNSDLDVSGFRKPWRQRPGLMRHYEAAQRGEYQVLIFYKISRLARNVREALDMISEFEKLGVAFHFVAERIDSSSAQGRFLRNVLLSAAEMQSEDTSAFLKSTCERRAKEGRLQGGSLPVWIKRTGPNQFDLIAQQVAAIRRLIELRLAGLGYVKIAQTLNIEGHRTVTGKYWTQGMTFKYLKSDWIETMQGVGFYNRGTVDEIKIADAFPVILTGLEADQIFALQRLYSPDYDRKKTNSDRPLRIGRANPNGRGSDARYSSSTVHLLSSILFCPQCGARMVAAQHYRGPNKPMSDIYRCPNYKTRLLEHTPSLNSIDALNLEDAVLRVVRGILVMPPDPVNDPKSGRAGKTSTSTNILESIQVRIDRLVTMHLDGKINGSDFERHYSDLLAEKEREQQRLIVDPRPAQHEQAQQLIEKGELSREELRQLVLLIVEKVEAPITQPGIVIRPGSKSLRKLARIKLKFPTADGCLDFLAPIYTSNFTGHRTFFAADDLNEFSAES